MTDVNPLITILYKDEELKTLLRRKGLRPMTKEESAYCTGWGVLAAWTLQGITDKRLKDKALVTLIEKAVAVRPGSCCLIYRARE